MPPLVAAPPPDDDFICLAKTYDMRCNYVILSNSGGSRLRHPSTWRISRHKRCVSITFIAR